MAGIHQVATGEGALTLRFKLPADFKINPLIDSRVSVTWGEPVQQTTAAVSGDSVSIPLQLSEGNSFVMADVTLYYCREGEEALCFINVFNYFVTLEVAAEHEIREISLEPRGRAAGCVGRFFYPSVPPAEVVYLILGSLQHSEACLRVYGHPRLLAVAAAVNGEDFVPFNEALFIKEPGRGASVAWHQDGVTHWDSPAWDEGIHGFNFMAQLYGSTPANGVWIVPGTHRRGKVDIGAMVAEAGSERLPDAVPIVCKPGDVAMTNRQVLHGSFANTSRDWRVTVNFRFHRRASVLGGEGRGFTTRRGLRTRSESHPLAPDRLRQSTRGAGGFPARPVRLPALRGPRRESHVLGRGGESEDWRDYNLLDLSI